MFYKVKKFQEEDTDDRVLLKLLDEFNPLIKKYSFLLNYEDAKSELTLAFIETLKKIPIDENRFKQNKYIVSYINKSIINTYIHLSKKKNNQYCRENPLNLNMLSSSIYPNFEDKLTVNTLINKLTKKEKTVIILKYFYEYSDVEIANIFGVSRQAINKTKNRALNKMKKTFNF